MHRTSDQVLTAAQTRAAEAGLIAGGTSVDELMQRAGVGAAEWVWRIGGARSVTVLTGPGNNGGDGWVIAEAIRQRGGVVAVVMAAEPATPAAQAARARYAGLVLDPSTERRGEVFVDSLFGTGLTRPLAAQHLALLTRLAASHAQRVAIDLPSGVEADLGLPLNSGLPDYDLTIALGAWKPAHFLMPAAAGLGALRLVGIGVGAVQGAAVAITQPALSAPPAGAHKYTRGLLGVVGGAMPGAARLAARAAQGAGAGYVKLFGLAPAGAPADLVFDGQPLTEALGDHRMSAVLVGPGLGRDAAARAALAAVLEAGHPSVLDADALVLLESGLLPKRSPAIVATPHNGELFSLERAFGLDGAGSKVERALALAQEARMVVVAKGPDTVVAAPDGRIAYAARGSSWLSTAGTGDVLAGTIASRLACGVEAFEAACQGICLHAEAARLCGAVFSAAHLAAMIRDAYAASISSAARL